MGTETTGLTEDAVVVQIAIVDGASGRLRYQSDVQLPERADPGLDAQAIHGIGESRLAEAPPWASVRERLEAILDGTIVVAFNAAFDERLLEQTCHRHGTEKLDVCWHCAMTQYADWRGHWRSLEQACGFEGIPLRRNPFHDARDDALATWGLVRRMAGLPAETWPLDPTIACERAGANR